MFEIGYISALIGGLLTFLAPCTLPLIPAYLGFLAGARNTTQQPQKKKVMLNAFLFTVAFSSVFIFFGLISGTIGNFFILHRALISQIGGILVICFGLSMLGVFELPQLFSQKKTPAYLSAGEPSSAFLLGLLFALGWSPCLGPILGTILVIAGASATAMHGASLLLVYSIGLALPFLVIAYVYGTSFSYLPVLARLLPYINNIGGIMFLGIGVLLIMGNFGLLNVWVEELFGNTWYNSLMDYM